MSNFDYVRKTYGVPAARGVRVRMEGRSGVITSAQGAHINVRFDGSTNPVPCHPTWEMFYLDEDGSQIFPAVAWCACHLNNGVVCDNYAKASEHNHCAVCGHESDCHRTDLSFIGSESNG
jgi:hypothetical protein